MSISDRLREERMRLGRTQADFAAWGNVQRRAQINYESGERSPDSVYLAALAAQGVDVTYVLTGDREFEPTMGLTEDEQDLLALYRGASLEGKAAAIGALRGAKATAKMKQVFKGKVGQQINTETLDQRGVSFFGGKKRK